MRTLILLGFFAWGVLSGSGDKAAPPQAQAERRVREAVRIQSIPRAQEAYRPRIMTVTPRLEYQPHIIMTEPWRPGDGPLRTYLGPRGERGDEEMALPPDVRRPGPGLRGGMPR